MSPIVRNGKATRSLSLAPPLDCQDVARYQAARRAVIDSRRNVNRTANAIWVGVVLVFIAAIAGAVVVNL